MFEKIKTLLGSFARRHLGGHVRIGPATIYGANAMRWAVNVNVPALGVTLCAAPPSTGDGWYFYASPNATPWAAVLGCGPGLDHWDRARIRERLEVLSRSPHPEHEVANLAERWGVAGHSARTRTGEAAPGEASGSSPAGSGASARTST